MKNIVILGSTGSIGRSSLEVIDKFPDRFRVVGLAAGRNLPLLLEQIERWRPRLVAVHDEDIYKQLKSKIGGTKPEILCGIDGICSIAENGDADTVISAIVGSAGLLPTISAIRAKKTVALANKETLVMAGELVMSEVKKHGTALLPVDSEHSAIFQCMRGYERESVKKIILTASGGPFVGKSAEELQNVSPENALKHPNWSMGKKISIDSATLMNKGLEVIEASRLFDLPPEKIDVLIHPQSIVHSMVEFNDGSYIAQLSRPDMKGPIAYALSYPERLIDVIEKVDWEKLPALTFRKPDNKTFPCLSIAYEALKTGGTMPAALNASNEIAVAAFLDGIIGFNRIPVIIKKVLDSHKPQPADSIDVVLEADKRAREETLKELNK
ncbi:MAG TPA: 1-deoxy-D-xylulose-5-phosphate reductoisomerase [Nitrospiraceae bacterium]|nr:MAG: 1-deoxy-D-xylulose-5-phosphate reductoisomerase [Nitrospirae bacterium GWA2_46_11]OGW22734.1 MAG: 1-deoxy-D-xylulose-5-phosphate reductoisomerase [Nitrospirae bacterium GWB2_47_37]HAK89743.1 1-deoxy-D-xylulose-5-phosphate reductoisomerase [Nitrospiraceae bacterium]HCZ11579.1 1-deoxy-D-xylulose-5-phosphate reductoisomerase [Nitrospiraceae bacterium]